MSDFQTDRAYGHFERFNTLVDSGWMRYLTHREIRVIMVLLRHSDADGESFPGAETIATKAGISTRAVYSTLCLLKDRGFVESYILPGRYRATRVLTIPPCPRRSVPHDHRDQSPHAHRDQTHMTKVSRLRTK